MYLHPSCSFYYIVEPKQRRMCCKVSKAVRLQTWGLGTISRSTQRKPVFMQGEHTEGLNTGLLTHQQNRVLFGFPVVWGSSQWLLTLSESQRGSQEERLCQICKTSRCRERFSVVFHILVQLQCQNKVPKMLNCAFRLLEHHSIWEKALLQTVHQALQRGCALGLCHPEDHWYEGASRNTNAAPYSGHWGGCSDVSTAEESAFTGGWCFK